MGQYSISDLEKLTGIKAHTLRMWEKRYAVCQPSRDTKNTRRYGESDLRRLMKLSQLTSQGHRISSIACLPQDELDILYEEKVGMSGGGCCLLDQLTLAIQKTQESKLYVLLQERLENLGIRDFASRIWEPMQERLGFLILSGALHQIHLKLFNQIVERLLESQNIDSMLNENERDGSALLINTCGSSSAVFHQLTKRLLVDNRRDVLSLSLCQSDWESLAHVFENRQFDTVFVHYQSDSFDVPPPYHMIDKWIDETSQVILYGTISDDLPIPSSWKHMQLNEIIHFIENRDVGIQMDAIS